MALTQSNIVEQIQETDSMDQVWQKCPECGFQFLIAQDELASTSLDDDDGKVVCPDCWEFFDFDPNGELE